MNSVGISDSLRLNQQLNIEENNSLSFPTAKTFLKEILKRAPEVFFVRDFISDKEIQHLMTRSATLFERSQVSPQGEVSDSRTSSTAYFLDSSDPLLNEIRLRAASLVDMPIHNVESIQITRYQPGQQFKDHVDFFPREKTERLDLVERQGGQRTHTILVYLNNLDSDDNGGSTVFPKLGISVRPEKGAALVWRNSWGLDLEDFRTLHRGEAPLKSEKYILSLWIRERTFIALPDAISQLKLESSDLNSNKS